MYLVFPLAHRVNRWSPPTMGNASSLPANKSIRTPFGETNSSMVVWVLVRAFSLLGFLPLTY